VALQRGRDTRRQARAHGRQRQLGCLRRPDRHRRA
jgi:hypothetical protein